MAICQDKPATPEEAYKIMERTIAKLSHKCARNHYQDFDDCFSEGCIGLMQAYNRYDSKMNCAFSSYAYQWIQACISGGTQATWKVYNNTGYKPVEDEDTASYTMDFDSKIDLERKIESQPEETQFIIRARLAGYTFQEISDLLIEHGHDYTLHQARKVYMKVMAE